MTARTTKRSKGRKASAILRVVYYDGNIEFYTIAKNECLYQVSFGRGTPVIDMIVPAAKAALSHLKLNCSPDTETTLNFCVKEDHFRGYVYGPDTIADHRLWELVQTEIRKALHPDKTVWDKPTVDKD